MKLEGFTDVSLLLRCGVYLLVHRGVVVYVGQTREGLTRLYTHRNLARRGNAVSPVVRKFTSVRPITFDEVHFNPCAPEALDDLERDLINRFKPRYNTQLKEPGPITGPIELNVAGQVLTLNQSAAGRIRRRA